MNSADTEAAPGSGPLDAAPVGSFDAPGDGPHPWPGHLTPATLDAATPSPDSAVPFRSVGFAISTLGHEVARRFAELLRPLGLEPREFALLRAVGADEGRSQQAMGERLRIGASRMVAFVDVLEARGLLERRLNAEDRRTRALHLTDEGRDLLRLAFALARDYERNLCAELSGPERDQLLDLLGRVGLGLGLPAGVHAAHVHSALGDE